MRIHYYRPDWETVNLHCDSRESLPLKMAAEAPGWWSCELPVNNTTLAFTNGIEWDSLGGVMGQYPQDPECFYRLSGHEFWIKNQLVYSTNPNQLNPTPEFTVLSLNLFTYQELPFQRKDVEAHVEAYAEIFDRIAEAIEQLKPDLVCLQEAGEPLEPEDRTYGDSPFNMGRQIQLRLSSNWNTFGDWSHVGFGQWREGEMVLTPHSIIETESRYVSQSKSKKSFKSRNPVRVKIMTPQLGVINVVSAHTGWWDDLEDPCRAQVLEIDRWINSTTQASEQALVVGDLNIPAGSEGYQMLTERFGWHDLYLDALPQGMHDATIGKGISGWEGSKQGHRIDYVFSATKRPALKATSAQRVFTEHSFGRVSDHVGVYVRIAFK